MINKLKLKETSKDHSDMVDSFAYMMAAQEAALREQYVLLHIKKKPWYLPELFYKFILQKVLVLSSFKR